MTRDTGKVSAIRKSVDMFGNVSSDAKFPEDLFEETIENTEFLCLRQYRSHV